MHSIFGLPMNTIMIALLVAFAVCLTVVAYVVLRNRIVFTMGVRNIPRRKAQTILIIAGLMLSTLIISAAFTTGDTVDYSVSTEAYSLMGHMDIPIQLKNTGSTSSVSPGGKDIPQSDYGKTLSALDRAKVANVDGYMGVSLEQVPVLNPAAHLSEPTVTFAGLDTSRIAAFPDVISANTGRALNVSSLAPGDVYMNESAADALDISPGDRVQVFVNNQPRDLRVVDIVQDRVMTGSVNIDAREGMVTRLDTLDRLMGHQGVRFIAVSITGGVRDTIGQTDQVEGELRNVIQQNGLPLDFGDSKKDAVKTAEQFGSIMTTMFLVLGLFSIGAGVLLIVMIFVMLAAERKSEMGMARAVGTQRNHLVQMFLSEGMAYNLLSAMVGALLGIGVAFALAYAMGAIFSQFGISMTPHVTLRTFLVSYCLGVVLTFGTVGFSSWRVSNLNIVRAIRDIPEPTGRRMGWRGMAFWTFALIVGGLSFWGGLASHHAFPFAAGFSLVAAGLAIWLRRLGLPERPVFTLIALIVLVTWGLTAGGRLEPLFGKLTGGMEMFFLSGTAMVTASTFTLIYNSDIVLAIVSRLGGVFGSVLPAVKTAVAYPLNNRFRTGMTLAMISLVVFALTMMSAMNLNFERVFLADESRGGWDIQVQENPNNPIADLPAALKAAGSDVQQQFRAVGRLSLAGGEHASEVRQDPKDKYDHYLVKGVDSAFIEGGHIKLQARATGYESDAAVWQALKTQPDVALVDAFTIESGNMGPQFTISGIAQDAKVFDPVSLTVHDPVSNIAKKVRVIGVIDYGSSSNFMGIFIPDTTFREVFGKPELSLHYVSLTDPGNSGRVARQIEASLLKAGVQADSLKEIADRNQALFRNFLRLMQGFMGLGLFVGIAAVGVIAFRTVVERRQQIGMLRAIGYKRSMVALSFLLESSFVTLLGILSGIGLALWLSFFLVTSDSFPSKAGFYIPWTDLGVIGVFTFLASLIMTWIPSRQAASIPVAEALRYE